MKKTTYQQKDYHSVLFGKAHNPGAGGVNILNAIDVKGMSLHRLDQKMNRSFRAVGL